MLAGVILAEEPLAKTSPGGVERQCENEIMPFPSSNILENLARKEVEPDRDDTSYR